MRYFPLRASVKFWPSTRVICGKAYCGGKKGCAPDLEARRSKKQVRRRHPEREALRFIQLRPFLETELGELANQTEECRADVLAIFKCAQSTRNSSRVRYEPKSDA